MEEELQQSVMLSEDAEYETADTAGEDVFTPAATKERTMSTVFAQTTIRGADGMEVDEEDDDDELSDRDASGEEIDEEMDQDAEGEDYTEIVDQQIVVSNGRPFQMNDDDDEEEDEEDEDADGEEDGDEGVGAVKIKPGDTDDEDEDDEDADSDVSEPLSNAEDDSDEEPAWEEAGEVEEDDDDESETGPSNVCMFCKQDEENDPSEDFEAFLTCSRCNDNGGS